MRRIGWKAANLVDGCAADFELSLVDDDDRARMACAAGTWSRSIFGSAQLQRTGVEALRSRTSSACVRGCSHAPLTSALTESAISFARSLEYFTSDSFSFISRVMISLTTGTGNLGCAAGRGKDSATEF